MFGSIAVFFVETVNGVSPAANSALSDDSPAWRDGKTSFLLVAFFCGTRLCVRLGNAFSLSLRRRRVWRLIIGHRRSLIVETDFLTARRLYWQDRGPAIMCISHRHM